MAVPQILGAAGRRRADRAPTPRRSFPVSGVALLAVVFASLAVAPTAPTLVAQSTGEQVDGALNELAGAYALDGLRLPPIPLDPRRPELGVALLPIHRKLLRARAQLAAGGPPDLPIEVPLRPSGLGVTLIAFPVACEGGEAVPREIEYFGTVAPRKKGLVRRMRGLTTADISALYPGQEIPAGALATAYFSRVFLPDDVVTIRYVGTPCPGIGAEVRLPVVIERPHQVVEVHAPESAEAGIVRLRALIDIEGALFGVAVVDGSPTLHYEALRLADGWRFQPGRINGAPVPLAAGFRIRFGPGSS